MRMRTILFAAAASLAATACAANTPLSPIHGEAVEANFHAMVADPRPAEGAPKPDARVIDAAIARYRAGQVKPPPTGEGYTPAFSVTGGSDDG